MKKKNALICICICAVIIISLCIWAVTRWVSLAGDNISTRWTIIGAIGSWAGSVFGAAALIIAIFALWLPQRVKIKVSVDIVSIISDIPEDKDKKLYSITVKNIGIKAVTVNNLFMNFDRKSNRYYYLRTPADSLLISINPSFPKRLEASEELIFHMRKDEMDNNIRKDISENDIKKPCFIYVNEVTKGKMTFKTNWTAKTFIEGQRH